MRTFIITFAFLGLFLSFQKFTVVSESRVFKNQRTNKSNTVITLTNGHSAFLQGLIKYDCSGGIVYPEWFTPVDVEINSKSLQSLDGYLSLANSLDSRFHWVQEEKIYNFLPLINSPKLLELEIKNFTASNVSNSYEALNLLFETPEVKKKISELNFFRPNLNYPVASYVPRSKVKNLSPLFSIKIQNSNFRQILNAIVLAEERSMIWKYFETKKGNKKYVEIYFYPNHEG